MRHSLRIAGVLAILLPVTTGGSASATPAQPERYVLDPDHMSIAFLVMHLGFARVLGTFNTAEGSFVFEPTGPTLRDIQVRIDAASVDTRHDARDDHLRSKDFLWADEHPTLTFAATSGTPLGEQTGQVDGDLTIRGVTKPVTLDVTWNRSGEYPFGDRHFAMGLSARTTILRSDYGMTYALEGDLVGDEVEIIIEVEAIRQP